MVVSEAQIVQSLSQLPAFPAVLPRVQDALRDENCTIARLEQLIAPDPAITANLLALVNSAAYALPRRVDSVRQALSLLGITKVVDVVTAAAFSRVLPDELPGYRIDAADFWTHCSAVAVLASRLQKALPAPRRGESVFTAALLHDLGKLAIAAFLEDVVDDALAQLREGDVDDFRGAEHEALGTDHCIVGELLATRWNLPSLVAAAARWHHAPGQAPDDLRQPVALIHLANALAHSLGLGGDAGELARAVDEASIRRLGLDDVVVQQVCLEALEEVEALGAVVEGTNAGSGAGVS